MPKDYTKNIKYYQKYNSKYYETHKSVILEQKKTPVFCEICKKDILKVNFYRHLKTNIHDANLRKSSKETL
jgi:hypothetical protein